MQGYDDLTVDLFRPEIHLTLDSSAGPKMLVTFIGVLDHIPPHCVLMDRHRLLGRKQGTTSRLRRGWLGFLSYSKYDDENGM